ncbi:MAG: hypothetical protein ACRD19_15675, partial [Terriglobia bacterium]
LLPLQITQFIAARPHTSTATDFNHAAKCICRYRLDRLKILLQGTGFQTEFTELNLHLRMGDTKRRELYAKQYHAFFEAILRNRCEDVTSQVIKAYKTAIKPSIKDFLPKRDALL